MNFLISLVVLLIITTICSLILTYLLIYVMPAFGIIDVPSKRRAHLKSTPRGGGLSFVMIFSVAFPAFEYLIINSLAGAIMLMQLFIPISILSFIDDISHVFIPLRLLMHILCSCLAVMWMIHPNTILHYEIPMVLDLAIGVFALLSFLNIYNFLDGIDGITANESIHLSSTILLLCMLRYDIIPNVDNIIIIATIIFGWSLGFIFFNWQPARIFIGDVGSIGLGFLLGICLLTIASASAKLFVACVIAALYYIADGGMTLLIRIVKGERIWEPHLQHFFQKAVRKGQTHAFIVKRIMRCNIMLMLFSINSLYYPVVSIICAIITVTMTIIRLVA